MSDFPYYKLFLPSPESMFQELKKEVGNDIDLSRENVTFERDWDYFKISDGISSHFTEEVRMKCNFNGEISPFSWWEANKKKYKGSKKDIANKREFVYSKTKECNSFNPAFMIYVFKKLFPESSLSSLKVLDPSSGWGDRMLASAAMNVRVYDGFDPNLNLLNPYKEIIDFIGNVSNTSCSIKHIPFEDAIFEKEVMKYSDLINIIQENHYDVAFTSPPYFSLEVYSEESTQSSSRYKTYDDWLHFMYTPYLRNCLRAVKRKEGFVCVYVSDYTDKTTRKLIPLFRDTITIMTELFGSKYETTLYLKVGKSTRPCVVFKSM